MQVLEIPKIIMGSLSLWDFCIGLRLGSMNDIREFECILDKENGYIVADNVPVTLVSVELDCKSTHVTDSVCTTTAAEDSGEADKGRSIA